MAAAGVFEALTGACRHRGQLKYHPREMCCEQVHHYISIGAVKRLTKEEAGKDNEVANVLY